jgi:hypothetical protein
MTALGHLRRFDNVRGMSGPTPITPKLARRSNAVKGPEALARQEKPARKLWRLALKAMPRSVRDDGNYAVAPLRTPPSR